MKKDTITSSIAKTIVKTVNMPQFEKGASYAVIYTKSDQPYVYTDMYEFLSESDNTVAMCNTGDLKRRVFDKSQYKFEKLV